MFEFLNFYFPVTEVNANIAYLILLGFFVGFLSGLLGIGGGVIIVPLLTIFFGVPMKVAIGTSNLYIAITGLTGIYKHIKNKFVNFKIVLAIGISAIIFAQVGASLCIKTPKETVQLLFGVLLILIGLYIIIDKFLKFGKFKIIETKTKKFIYGFFVKFREEKFFVNIPKAIVIGMITGLFSGFFGIGGAVILIPLMLYILKFPIYLTIGCSLTVAVLSAFSGSIIYFTNGFVDIFLVIWLSVGSVFGSYIGAYIAPKIKQKKLEEIFAIVVIIIGLKMIGFI